MSKDIFPHVLPTDSIPIVKKETTAAYDVESKTIQTTSEHDLGGLIMRSTDLKTRVSAEELSLLQSEDVQLANQETSVFFQLIESHNVTYLCVTKEFILWLKLRNISGLEILVKILDSLRGATKWWDIDEEGNLAEEGNGIRNIAIELLKKTIPLTKEEYEQQIEKHELTHYVDISAKNSGATAILFQVLEDIYLHYSDTKFENNEIVNKCFKQAKMHQYLFEATAIAHEVFGSVIDKDKSEFHFPMFTKRLLNLFQSFNTGVGMRPKIEEMITIELNGDSISSNMSEHDVGTLVMLFGDNILSSTGSIDLNILLDKEQKKLKSDEKVNLILSLIINRIKFVIDDPIKFKEEFISNDVYSSIVGAQDRVGQSTFKYLIDNEAENISEVFQDQDKVSLMNEIFGTDNEK